MKTVKKYTYLFIFAGIMFFLPAGLFSQNKSPAGQWKTIDDETGKVKSIVEISVGTDGKLYGKIIKLFKKPDEDQDPVCDKCEGDKKDKKIIGMQIMWELEKDSETEWEDGHILDPKNGKTYGCEIEVIENGAKLKVRGYLGFSLLGRTQIWLRVN